MDEPSTSVNSATCMLNQAMTGIQVAKPTNFQAVALACPDCGIGRRDHIEPEVIGALEAPWRRRMARESRCNDPCCEVRG
ncbi:hypothetical protein VFPPC_15897 [Pochonia chlamydosporia 170]|uniref:Uncharacterized protein n=1 Tax=Pochonia chlamydosporia 170 TaxID=1380566 RepID=A0A179FTE5_METCM|nr:hypothetical protein VFPPC_15897 [Pochonia chlamydosporia 170]OAQ68916.1 hypothetical protein VFPPC_15897 [Pochonia chlamydosporia 170]